MSSFSAVGGRPRTAWLTALGLLGAGWVTAHVLSYLIVVPETAERRRILMESGHGYFRAADLLILCLTLAVAGFAICVLTAGNAPIRAPSPWILALLPPIGFAVQEHLERLQAGGAFPTHLLAEPRFVLGLLLQVPFALGGVVLVRLLDRALRGLTSGFGRSGKPELAVEGVPWIPGFQVPVPRLSALALRQGQRAPPLSTRR